MYQIFSSLRNHLHFFVHFFFTFMEYFFCGHPISSRVELNGTANSPQCRRRSRGYCTSFDRMATTAGFRFSCSMLLYEVVFLMNIQQVRLRYNITPASKYLNNTHLYSITLLVNKSNIDLLNIRLKGSYAKNCSTTCQF